MLENIHVLMSSLRVTLADELDYFFFFFAGDHERVLFF